MEQPTASESAPIFSEFADDPDLAELVEMFVEEIPDRMQTLQDAFVSEDMDSLLRCAHQLKGAMGSYGFGDLSPMAASLEAAVHEQAQRTQIEEELARLLDACGRMRSTSAD